MPLPTLHLLLSLYLYLHLCASYLLREFEKSKAARQLYPSLLTRYKATVTLQCSLPSTATTSLRRAELIHCWPKERMNPLDRRPRPNGSSSTLSLVYSIVFALLAQVLRQEHRLDRSRARIRLGQVASLRVLTRRVAPLLWELHNGGCSFSNQLNPAS